ncbi:MAG: CDP-alcohol phosphatidyltransferase family protein, partial [Candidatus Micrarchaeota archaeon]|nr:CDP-alcohol phosphatidyltransferase family protein [Candidatus Micrarchaeota archaeon]
MKFDRLLLKDFVTLASGAFGFLAIVLAVASYWTAALFVGFAAVLDFLDGKVARHTGKHNAFGRELDSLSDAVAFGAAPAFAAFTLQAASPFYWLYAASAVVFLAAALVRLARFNLYASAAKGVFYGIPAPAAAVMLVVLAPVLGVYSPVAFLGLGA